MHTSELKISEAKPLLAIPFIIWCLFVQKKDNHVIVSFAPVWI